MLHLERDHRDLQRTFDLYKQRTERASKELEKTNQKMNTQNHNDRKEIVRLKEVSHINSLTLTLLLTLSLFRNLSVRRQKLQSYPHSSRSIRKVASQVSLVHRLTRTRSSKIWRADMERLTARALPLKRRG